MSAQCKSSAGPGDSPASSRAGQNVSDGIEYTSAEIERLLGDLLGRSMLEPRGLDDGTTLLKVLAYVTRLRNGDVELLVFDHRDAPEAGIQVPAGTIEPGESPDVAACANCVKRPDWRMLGPWAVSTCMSGSIPTRTAGTGDTCTSSRLHPTRPTRGSTSSLPATTIAG